MIDPLRIALVSPYDFSHPGGVNEHVRYLARHLRGSGHTVEIIGPVSDPATRVEGLIHLDSPVVAIPFGGSIARVSLAPSVWGEIRDIFARRRYDIVHVHEPPTLTISPAALHYSRSITVGTFHQYRESHPVYEFSRPLLARFIEKLDGRIAVSRAARSLIESYFPGDYRVIPNGIELADFQRPEIQPIDQYANDGKLNILFMGRLDKRKGFRYLLRAFRIVKEAVPEARLLVAGGYDREDRLTYVRYVRHFRVRDVKFVGYVPAEEKARWYRSAHIFCAPSTGFESFGIVLTEAMASGTPVIASNIAGYRGVIHDGVTGYLVPPENEEALADAIILLLRDAALRERLRRAALEDVKQYDWATVSASIESYYLELLARDGQPKATPRGQAKVGAD